MSKYYYSYFSRKKKKYKFTKRLISLLIFFSLTFLLYLVSSDKVYNLIKIKKVYIKNYTTVPDSVILEEIINTNTNAFNYPFVLKKIEKKYPEIFKIKVLGFPFFDRKLEIVIFARECLFYISKYNDYVFYSKDKKWYKPYNPFEFIKSNKVREICVNKYLDINKIYELNNLIENTKLADEVYKIEVKDNKEYVLHLKEGAIFILRENFDLLNTEMISKVFDILHKKANRIYGCLLHEGFIFYD